MCEGVRGKTGLVVRKGSPQIGTLGFLAKCTKKTGHSFLFSFNCGQNTLLTYQMLTSVLLNLYTCSFSSFLLAINSWFHVTVVRRDA